MDEAEGRPADPGLPEPMVAVLADYERHLVAERDLTPHTVRAYLGDISGLLEHAARLGHTDVTTLDLRALRSWLARQQTLRAGPDHDGAARHRGPGLHRVAAAHRTHRDRRGGPARLTPRHGARSHRRSVRTRPGRCSRPPRPGPTTAARSGCAT